MKNATTEPLALLERVCVMDRLLKHFLPLLSPNFFFDEMKLRIGWTAWRSFTYGKHKIIDMDIAAFCYEPRVMCRWI